MTEEIRLVIPAEEDFRPIAHLVTGGLALRLDLTYDTLEDLQIAVEALLQLRDDPDEVTVTLRALDDTVRATVGPLPAAALEQDGGELGVRQVLDAVCDSVEIEERDGGLWVELQKKAAEA